MPLVKYKGQTPVVEEGAYVSPNSTIIGNVLIKKNSVIWPGCVIRAEFNKIEIGEYSTIFDGVVLFTRSERSSIYIGNYNIIGSGVFSFGMHTEDYVEIGENCLINEGVYIGEGAIILKESYVPPEFKIAERSVMKGYPIEKIRELNRNDVMKNKDKAENYAELFIKVVNRFPNIQPYVLTLEDFMKMVLEGKFKLNF